MKIVILDGFTVNPGDISWDELKNFGHLKVYDRTESSKVKERIEDADVIITSKVNINKDVIESAENLKYIGVIATGFDNIDIKTAKDKKIAVTNIAGYSTYNVAEFVFSMILGYYHRIYEMSQSVLLGNWKTSSDYCYYPTSRMELYGKTMGIIGYGSIGSQVAKIASALGLNVLIHSRTHDGKVLFDNCNFATKEEIFEKADIISLHCPLTDDTRNLINKGSLKAMKKTALLINTSRGPVINEDDLFEGLKNHEIAHACIDVLSIEPMAKKSKLCDLDNITITPHVAWSTPEARVRIVNETVKNLKAFLDGEHRNRVEGKA